MSRRLFKLRRLVSRRIGASIILLAVASAVLLVATVWLFASLSERQDSVAQSVREDAVWAAFQADREASRLIEVALDPVGATPERLTLQYDLLYSRIGLLGGGKYVIAFGKAPGVSDSAALVSERVLALAPTMDAIAADPTVASREVAAILAQARHIQDATGKLLMAANAAVNGMRVKERAEALATYSWIGASVTALTLVLVLIVALLAAQLVHISRSGRELELLSLRHARSAEQARAANRAKSSFLATMSHEIRTPLNGIIGMADVVDATVLTAEQRQQLQVIRQSGYVLLDVINDILDYSKLEAGAVTIDRRSFALADIMEPIRAIMQPRADSAGLALTLDYPNVALTTDGGRFRQVLINLVGNAIKFTAAGAVSIKAEIVGDRLVCSVSDTGPGIGPDDLPRLFKDFSQLDSSSTRSHGGTGLGLAICKRLAKALDGNVGVESQLGQGSRFWIDIPVTDLQAAAPSQKTPSAPQPVMRSGTALVVDDNEVNRTVAGALLERMGLTVLFATNGKEALDCLAKAGPDIVFMDMQMPVLDGLEATRLARAMGLGIPIIGLTANAFDTDRSACLAAGMNEFIAKPVTRDKLAAVLDKARPPSEPQLPVSEVFIDVDYQRILADELGQDAFDALLVQFRRDAMSLIDQAVSARAEMDADRLDGLLHTLKGASLTLGFRLLADHAERLRQAEPSASAIEQLRRFAA